MRQMGGATVPARLDLERATNPFLRARTPEFKARLGLENCRMPKFSPRSAGARTLSEQVPRRRLPRADDITAIFLRFGADARHNRP